MANVYGVTSSAGFISAGTAALSALFVGTVDVAPRRREPDVPHLDQPHAHDGRIQVAKEAGWFNGSKHCPTLPAIPYHPTPLP